MFLARDGVCVCVGPVLITEPWCKMHRFDVQGSPLPKQKLDGWHATVQVLRLAGPRIDRISIPGSLCKHARFAVQCVVAVDFLLGESKVRDRSSF